MSSGSDSQTGHLDHLGERLAAIDCGTNSFHLVVVRILPDRGFSVLAKEKIVVRLGESPKQIKKLTDAAMKRGVDALNLFRLVAQRWDAPVRAVATSAVREANNGQEFIDRVQKATGIEIEVVSGFEEARLIYLGVLQALPVFDERIALIDIGGGSTELLVGEAGVVHYANSFKIGAIRMTQRFFPEERITAAQVERCRLYVRGDTYFAVQEIRKANPKRLVASSGTAQTIAAMAIAGRDEGAPDSLNEQVISLKEIRSVMKSILSSDTYDERAALPGSDPRRADILAAGGLVLQTLLEETGMDSVTISSYALREGIILDSIRKARGKESPPAHLSNLRYDSVMKVGRTYRFDEGHAKHVATVALRMFDRLQPIDAVDESARELLEAAALLHDIGYYISHSAHHKHALYLIQNSEMLGFSNEEIAVIANVARYHRKSHPKERHDAYSLLDSKERKLVRYLAGILRIADGLDRTHQSLVRDVEIEATGKKSLSITAVTRVGADASHEIWSAERKKDLLEEALRRTVTIEAVQSPVEQE